MLFFGDYFLRAGDELISFDALFLLRAVCKLKWMALRPDSEGYGGWVITSEVLVIMKSIQM